MSVNTTLATTASGIVPVPSLPLTAAVPSGGIMSSLHTTATSEVAAPSHMLPIAVPPIPRPTDFIQEESNLTVTLRSMSGSEDVVYTIPPWNPPAHVLAFPITTLVHEARQLAVPTMTDEHPVPTGTEIPPVFPPVHGPGWQPPNIASPSATESTLEPVHTNVARSAPEDKWTFLGDKLEERATFHGCETAGKQCPSSSVRPRSIISWPVVLPLSVYCLGVSLVYAAREKYRRAARSRSDPDPDDEDNKDNNRKSKYREGLETEGRRN
ncbi:uncharacterized protein B0I36DRAFT_388214 [Microdochium trichocladiopsis]|uniref:Uncharacterized protein n=1 Tax=Microdochium trichocladiopsis TaxID=1682393 RepID=A0A9P8XYV2_9PEZI|nr:uncharacterized protein B0I36DRAFT_436070 [Microdochium trichocladiopsis]XP_046007741.1 uncharacterized protein B0I36DRAFT_388214 [Microdochium trichocladiopsis]KAH7016369.1 hypothetical protein B0I36DRAFT_436070 [Microdochium trichocladiopsis]KAH7021540.1 hypothetical protein B0I36DRAFT_388214 [Microdochium trichocladiopsis]